MLPKSFLHKLKTKEKILMDGAMGTEILNRGVPTTLPLWSAEANLSHPQVVQQIYEDYIKAGAEIIITNTFNTTRRMFDKKNMGDKAREATIAACRLAQKARTSVKSEQEVFIAGSVSPLEDCYSPELTPSQSELDAEHMELITDLKDGGVDFILIETMITLRETLAALRAAKDLDLPVAVSFCCNDQLQLLGGESLKEVVKKVEKYNPLFIGVNCVSPQTALQTVTFLHTITSFPISAYAQGDGMPDDDQGWKFEKHDQKSYYVQMTDKWIAAGATVIGGCCGTTPAYIESIAEEIKRM